MPGNIVIYEPAAGGHQLYHVRLIAEAAQAAGLKLTFATTERALAHASAAPLLDVLKAGGSEIMVTKPNPDQFAFVRRVHPVLQSQFSHAASLRAGLIQRGGRQAFDLVFIPFFDAYMTCPLAMGLNPCLGIPMAGILHRTRFHMPAVGIQTTLPFHVRVEKYVYAAMLRRTDVRLLFTMDMYLDRFYANNRVKFLPDPAVYQPVRTREAVRAELGIAPGQMCILAYGALDSRKAIDTLLQGVHGLSDPSQVCVVVAGSQDPLVKDILGQQVAQDLRSRGILREVPGFLSDSVVDDLFLASDLCWICYLNSDGNSGVMVKAGHAERPVISAGTGITARIVADDHVGWQADPQDASVVTATLGNILADPPARVAAAAAIKRRFEAHTIKNFVDPIVTLLAEARLN